MTIVFWSTESASIPVEEGGIYSIVVHRVIDLEVGDVAVLFCFLHFHNELRMVLTGVRVEGEVFGILISGNYIF